MPFRKRAMEEIETGQQSQVRPLSKREWIAYLEAKVETWEEIERYAHKEAEALRVVIARDKLRN